MCWVLIDSFALFMITIVSNIILPSAVKANPQILDTINEFCDFNFGTTTLKFPSKTWEINTSDYLLHFSLCKNTSTCKNNSSSCVIMRKTNEFITTGHQFEPSNSGDFVLQSIGGSRCPRNGNYKIIIKLDCTSSIKNEPQLIVQNKVQADECTFEINLRRPDCAPKCTGSIDGKYLIDLRSFPRNLEIKSDDQVFRLSLCGLNNNCPPGVAVCQVLNDGRVVGLATLDSQSVSYDVGKNELTARGNYKEKKGMKREVRVLIKCNWKTELANAVYKKVPTQGRKYAFELESSFGCVKLPQNCVTHSLHNLKYDLSGLYRPHSYWEVAKVPEGRLILNICGPLEMPANSCTDEYSQVCHLKGGNYLNRGSILRELKVEDDIVRVVFTSGSVCIENVNGSTFYSTKIEMKCSGVEKGPVFKEQKGCETLLEWETPHACPSDYSVGDKCYVVDRLGSRNLRNLSSGNDKIQMIGSTDDKIMYNLCGPIHSSCNGHTNVTFCLKRQQKETVLGWENTNLISDNGLLKMEFSGDSCLNNDRAKIVVFFVCNYEDPSPPPHFITISDNCQYNVTIRTKLACISSSTFLECSHNINETHKFELSPLVSQNTNYVIRDPNSNEIEYELNICGPIVTNRNVLCGPNTMICMINKTEPNIKFRYVSLGTVAAPALNNSKLFIDAKLGTFCQDFGRFKSSIDFECSEIEEQPKLVKKELCVYNFVWRTSHACPFKKIHVVSDSTRRLYFDLNDLQQKRLNITVGNDTTVYELNLCSDNYTIKSENSTETRVLKRQMSYKEANIYVKFDLNNSCTDNRCISQVLFEIVCDFSAELNRFVPKVMENSSLEILVETSKICDNKTNFHKYHVQEVEEPKVEKVQLETTEVEKTHEEPKVERVKLETREVEKTHEEPKVEKVEFETRELEKTHQEPKVEKVELETTEVEKTHEEPKVERVELKTTELEKTSNYHYTELKCSLTNHYTGYEINLKELKSFETLFEGSKYSVNLDGQPSCPSLICINDKVKEVSTGCPAIKYDYMNSFVQLQFNSSETCHKGKYGVFQVELWLKCVKNAVSFSVQKHEECKLSLDYFLPQACLLTDKNVQIIKESHTSVIVGSLIGTISLVAVVLAVVLIVRRRNNCKVSYFSIPSGPKNNVPIYRRDTCL